MKYNMAFKFLAVALCALMLLGAVGSAAGILTLTEGGLYDRTVEELREERLGYDASALASVVAVNYADAEFGGCPSQIMENNAIDEWTGWYYGAFDPSLSYYELKDAEGNVLESGGAEDLANAKTYTYPVSDPYRYVISIAPAPVTEIVIGDDDGNTENNIPDGGVAEVYSISISYDGGSESMGGADPIGFIWDSGDAVLFDAYQPGLLELPDAPITSVTFKGEDDTVLYGVTAGGTIGSFTMDEYGLLHYNSSVSDTQLLPTDSLIDSVPPEGADVYTFSLKYDSSSDGGNGVSSKKTVGKLSYDDAGNLQFQASVDWAGIPSDAVLHYAEFRGKEGNILYRTTDEYTDMTLETRSGGLFAIHFKALTKDTPELESFVEATQATEVSLPHTRLTLQADTDIYSMPSPDSDVVGHLAAGTTVEVSMVDLVVNWGYVVNGWIQLDNAVPASQVEATVPETTVTEPAAVTAAEADTVPATEPVITEKSTSADSEEESTTDIDGVTFINDKVYSDTYWDSEAQQNMEVKYRYASAPELTVELSIAPGGYQYDAEYDLLKIVWNYRNDLFWILGVSLVLFAVLAVYLCCAAGRKPGTEEVHAAGFNCIPLDVYLVGAAMLMVGIVALVVCFGEDLLKQSISLACVGACGVGYLICLIFVAFCFACAAQFKTPGGYWWRNSLCFRCLNLCEKCIRAFFKGCGWLVRHIPKGCHILWGWVLAILLLLKRPLVWAWGLVKKTAHKIGKTANHFYSLMPMTWQWMLTGFILVMLMFASFAARSAFMIVLSLCAGVAVVLYGAYCFATLMESARRMSQGDLDTKVDDKYLIGAFSDFAEDLNDLAGVAVVAAQKQLKSERMKTELITNVSHDIKTPLTSIINYVDLMQKPHTAEEEKAYLEVLDRQSQRLKKLIDDLMELSKATTGNLPVDITRLDAEEAVNQALGEFSDKLAKAQLTPVFRHPEEHLSMMADGRLAWRVLSNLLGNAVKYALPGTRLYIDLLEAEGKVIISLKNISRDELNVDADELMERFVRGDDSRNTEGSGLGLNIAKTLMELQKGQLQLLVDGDLFKVTLIFPGA